MGIMRIYPAEKQRSGEAKSQKYNANVFRSFGQKKKDRSVHGPFLLELFIV